jgi:hypothetical protein
MSVKKQAVAGAVSTKKLDEYYCVAVQRDYESQWRIVSKHDTREEAQAEVDKRRGFTGAFNYDNAQLRIISRSEGKKEFGKKWEYTPIGGARPATKSTV